MKPGSHAVSELSHELGNHQTLVPRSHIIAVLVLALVVFVDAVADANDIAFVWWLIAPVYAPSKSDFMPVSGLENA